MSSRPQLDPVSVMTNGNMATSLTSDVTIIKKLSMISYDVSWSGTTPVGEITVEISNTYSQNADGTVRNAGDWAELPLSTTCPVTGNSGNGFIDIFANSGFAIRCVYTRASGTGSMNIVASAKVT